jgi:RimJ/RimL family protein N-acetyltransferase
VTSPRFPILAGRLVLRPFGRADLDDFFAYWSLPDVARYVPWQPGDRAQATVALERRMADRSLEHPGQVLTLAVVEQASGRVIGEMMLRWLEGDHEQGEIGFAFNPEFQGQGLAYEASVAVLALGFDGLQLHRIIGRCDARNADSARLMTRLGMRQEGHFRHNEFFKGEWTDELTFAILDEEWRSSLPVGE